MRPGPLRRRRKRKFGDEAYKAEVAKLPCCACGSTEVHVHHSTVGHGLSRKAGDRDTFPLCHLDHHDFHTGAGRFVGWTREQRRTWQLEMVSQTRKQIEKE